MKSNAKLIVFIILLVLLLLITIRDFHHFRQNEYEYNTVVKSIENGDILPIYLYEGKIFKVNGRYYVNMKDHIYLMEEYEVYGKQVN